MGKRKLAFILLLVVALIGFAYFVLSRAGVRSGARQRLPDGSYLRLGAVGFGNVHSYYARDVMGWRLRVGRALPMNLAVMLGWKSFGGGSLTISGGLTTNVDVFTVFEGKINSRYSILRLVVSDDVGKSFDAGTSSSVATSSEGSYRFQINGWVAPAFSAQSKQLHLLFYDFFKKDSPCVAEFTVPNPAAENTPAH